MYCSFEEVNEEVINLSVSASNADYHYRFFIFFSPCYIDSDCDIVTSVRRVTWGRFMNCGQTCVAPDYVICHSRDNERIVKAFRSAVKELYGEDPQQNPAYARIVNQRHFK